MDGFRIPVGSWVDAGVDWVRDNLSGLLDLVAVVVRFLVGGLSDVLLAAPIIVVIVVAAALAWLLRSWKLALGTVSRPGCRGSSTGGSQRWAVRQGSAHSRRSAARRPARSPGRSTPG